MASNMVSEESRESALDIPNTTDAKYSNPLLAKAPLKADARFPFVLWRPRDGRNQAYSLWIINLQQLLKREDEQRATELPSSPRRADADRAVAC